MATTNSQRLRELRRKREEENKSSSSLSASTGLRNSEKIEKSRMERNIGFDTFETDLNNMNSTIQNVYNGWQTPETMANTKASVEALHERLKSYQTYQSKYGGSDISDTLNSYQSVLDDWDKLSSAYGHYGTAEAFDHAKKNYEMEQMFRVQNDDGTFRGLTYDEVQEKKKEYAEDSDEYKFLDKYTGFTDLTDFDKAIEAEKGAKKTDFLLGPINFDASQAGKVERLTKEKNATNPFMEQQNAGLAERIKNPSLSQEAVQEDRAYLEELEMKRNQHAIDNAFDLYKDLMNAEDFEETSQYVSTKVDGKWKRMGTQYGLGYEDLIYEYINNVDGIRDEIEHKATTFGADTDDTVSSMKKKNYDLLTEDEVKVYNSLYEEDKKNGTNKAEKFLDDMEVTLGKRAYTDQTVEWEAIADSGFLPSVGLSALSVPASLVGGVTGGIEMVGDALTGKDYNPYSYYKNPTNFAYDSRKYVGENIAEETEGMELFGHNIPSLLYGVGMSRADSIVGGALFKGNAMSAILGSSAAQQRAKELTEEGASQEEIMRGAMIAGGAEFLGEKFGYSELMKAKDIDSVRKIFTAGLKQSGSEALEESATEVLNILGDIWNRGEDSDFKQAIADYKERGFDDKEAFWNTFLDFGGDVVWAGIGGALSGGPAGSIKAAGDYNNLSHAGKQIRANDRVGEMADLFDTMEMQGLTPEQSEAYKLYGEYLQKKDIENLSNARLGNLYQTSKREAYEDYFARKSTQTQKTDAEKRLLKLNEIATERPLDEVARRKRVEELNKGEITEFTSTGNSTKIEGVRFEDGSTIVLTPEGEVKAEDLTFSANDAEILAYAEGMSEEKANVFVAQYDGKSDVDSYIESFEMAYAYGEIGMDADSVLRNKGVLTEKQASEIYKNALINRVSERQKAIDAINKKQSGNVFVKGRFDDSIIDYEGTVTDGSKVAWKDLTSTQREAITFAKGFSEAAGVNITFIKSDVKNGKRIGKNGSYNPVTNTIEIDVYAGIDDVTISDDFIIPTLSHEMTHWMKAKAPAMYSKIQAHALETLKMQGITTEDRVNAEINRMKEAHPDMEATKEMALDEIVARYCEDMLSNSKTAREFLGRMSDSEQKSFIAKVKETFTNLMEWVNKLLGQYKSKSKEAAFLREYNGRLKEVSEMWDKALEEAIQSNQNLQAEGITGKEILADAEKIHYSTRESFTDEISQWQKEGRPSNEIFILGSTGDVLQGLGAIESDIYMHGAKINKILEDHPEMTLEEIKKLPQILDNPILVLKSKGSHPKVVLFGSVKAKNRKPILTVLDLRPTENGFTLDDMQKVSSAYTKTETHKLTAEENGMEFVKSSEILYAEKNKTTNLLSAIGFYMPITCNHSGFIGSITYKGTKINIEGKSFDDVFWVGKNDSEQYSDRDNVSVYEDRFIDDLKEKQLNIVLEANPVYDSYHTWIRTKEDILTFEEALNSDDYIDYKGEDFDPSYPYSIAEEALRTGEITVYSSYQIGQGTFVSPSIMEAESYSGNGKVYSKIVKLTDVAWIDPTQGMYAKVDDMQFSDRDTNEFGLSRYSAKEIENWSGSNILYANSEQDVIDYVENHVRTGENTRLYCGKISGALAERIKKDTGYDLEGYNVSITSSFENSHADENAEALSGQIAMTPSEVAKFPYVISNYDTVTFGGFSKESNPVLKFEKTINGKKIAVTYILTKRRMLKLHTIYGWAEKKNHLTATNAPMNDADARTSGTNSDTDSNNIISDSAENTTDFEKLSDREKVSVYDVMGETGSLKKQNELLKADIEALKKRLKLERQVTHGNTFNAKQLKAVAKHLLNISKSDYSENTLVEELREVYSYIVETSQLDWEVLMAKSYDVARRVLDASKGYKVTNNYFKDVLADIRSARISLSEEQIQEAKNVYGEKYRNAFMGRVMLVKNGTSLDQKWQEWSDLYPEIFDANVTGADQITALSDIYDSLREGAEIYQTYKDVESIRAFATEIYNQYWNVSTVTTTADKYDKQIKKLNFEHRKAMSELRNDYKQKLKDQKLADAIYYGDIVNKIRQKNQAELSEAKRLGKQRMSDYRDRVARKEKIERITKKAMTLNDWLTKNSKDEHIPEVMKAPVAYLLNAIDFSSKQLLGMNGTSMAYEPTRKDVSLSRALEQVHDMVQRINSAQIGEDEITEIYGTFADFPAGFDKDIKSLSGEVNDIMREVGDNAYVLNQMTLEQLESLDKIITTMKSTATKMNKFLAIRHAESVANLSRQSMGYMDSLGKAKIHEGMRGKVDKLLDWGNALPFYTFKRFGEGGQMVYEALQDGWDKFAFHVKAIIDYAESAYTSNEVKEWSKEIVEFDILEPATEEAKTSKDYKPTYQKVQMSVPQIMSLYCLQKREQAKSHLMGGGMRIADIKIKNETVSQTDGVILSESEIDTIIKSLTGRQKEVADKLQTFMNTTCTDWGNEVSMLRFGYKAFGEENYFPIQSDKNNLAVNDETEQNNSLFRLLNMPFTKGTIKKANNRIVVSDIFDVFAQHTSDMAKYNALALPVLDAFKWYNYKEKIKKGDTQFATKSLKQSLENAFGKDGQNYIVTFLKDINGVDNVGRDALAKGFFSNAKIASVANNLRVVALQPTSYLRASALIDPKYLTKAFAHKPKYGMAEKYCGIALWKSLGFYDTNIQKGVTELIKHDETLKDKITDGSLKGAEMADKLTWGYLWNACELEVRDKQKNLKVGSEEFYEAISLRLREVIYSTQVVDSTMTRSQMMRSGDFGDKMVTAFASEPTLAYNMVQDCYYDWKLTERQTGSGKAAFNKHKEKMVRVVAAYTVTNLISSLIEAGFEAYRDDEEEKSLEDFMKMYLSNFGSNMGITTKIPYVKDLISIIQGFTSTRTDTQWMQNMVYAAKAWIKILEGDGNAYKAVYRTLQSVSQLSGIPISNAMREVVTAWNNTIGNIYPSLKIK